MGSKVSAGIIFSLKVFFEERLENLKKIRETDPILVIIFLNRSAATNMQSGYKGGAVAEYNCV